MGIIELFILAVGLSMDAFAVSICKGLATPKIKCKHMILAGLWFGGFQALMPTIGYFLGSTFASTIKTYDHWVAFVLLSFIGGNMLKEAFSSGDDDGEVSNSFAVKTMFIMAIATSIDALAVGVTFAFLEVNVLIAAAFIGVTTFAFSFAGVKIGNIFGAKYEKKAEIIGGLILIALGIKIIVEHLM